MSKYSLLLKYFTKQWNRKFQNYVSLKLNNNDGSDMRIYEPHYEQTNDLHMRKQRRRSASQ